MVHVYIRMMRQHRQQGQTVLWKTILYLSELLPQSVSSFCIFLFFHYHSSALSMPSFASVCYYFISWMENWISLSTVGNGYCSMSIFVLSPKYNIALVAIVCMHYRFRIEDISCLAWHKLTSSRSAIVFRVEHFLTKIMIFKVFIVLLCILSSLCHEMILCIAQSQSDEEPLLPSMNWLVLKRRFGNLHI